MYVVAIEGEHEDIARTVNADSSFNCELGESREVFNESMVAEENDFAIASAACSSSRIASEIQTFSSLLFWQDHGGAILIINAGGSVISITGSKFEGNSAILDYGDDHVSHALCTYPCCWKNSTILSTHSVANTSQLIRSCSHNIVFAIILLGWCHLQYWWGVVVHHRIQVY